MKTQITSSVGDKRLLFKLVEDKSQEDEVDDNYCSTPTGHCKGRHTITEK